MIASNTQMCYTDRTNQTRPQAATNSSRALTEHTKEARMLAMPYDNAAIHAAQPLEQPKITQIYVASRTTGYAAVLVSATHVREIYAPAEGNYQHLALTAIVRALESCQRPQVGHVFAPDEQLVHIALGWQQPVNDIALWERLAQLRAVHCMGFIYVSRESKFVWVDRARTLAGLRGAA